MSAAAVLPPWTAPELPDVLDRRARLDPDRPVPFGATVDVEHVLLSSLGLAVVTTIDSVPETVLPLTEAAVRGAQDHCTPRPVAWVPARPILVVPGLGDLGYGTR